MAPRRFTVPLVASSLLLAAALGLAPIAAGQFFGGTQQPDIVVDARVSQLASYENATDGTLVSPVALPAGGAVRQNSSYDLRVTGLNASRQYGYGGVGNSTVVRLVDSTGVVVSTAPLVAVSGEPGLHNATFLSFRPTRAGSYIVEPIDGSAPGNWAAAVFVQPADVLSVSVTPQSPQCVEGQSILLTVRVVNASGPVPGALVSSDFLPPGATTNAVGNYTYFGSCPALGAHGVRATRDFGGHQFPNQSIPEEEGTTSVTFTAAPTTLRVGYHHGGLLAPTRAPIALENARDLGAITFTLSLDASVAGVADVTPGNLTGANMTWSYNESQGVLTVLVTTAARPGPSIPSAVLANVWLEATGPVGSRTDLDVEVAELVDSNGTAQAASAFDGSFRAGILGDVDGDGLIASADADALAAVVVGSRSASTVYAANADLNGDGRLSGVDVMRLRQHLAGTRESP